MSAVRTLAVRLPVTAEIATLLDDIESAGRRAEKSEPGERVEIAAFEALCSTLEAKAAEALVSDPGAGVTAPSASALTVGLFQRGADQVTVSLTSPLEPGTLSRTIVGIEAPRVAETVEVRDDIHGRRLVETRFRGQLEEALRNPGKDRSSALSPSGIHNRVLTEVLRAYVDRRDAARVDVPVVYRDGSRAGADFPFRSLNLVEDLRDAGSLELDLRLTLLSIRHTEMDPVVDGAWLRNAEVSKPRPAAQTDDFVYHASVQQLRELTANGTKQVRLRMFQTGLETAVVGFFRAVTEFLIDYPGRLEVIPMFYSASPKAGIVTEFAGFEAGQAWTTRS